jgi:AcrR family transcriptional regulator
VINNLRRVATRTRTRLDPQARRAQLVGLGVDMLSTRPLDQVAIDEIAAEAGISRGLLFHYFPTKRDFHVAVAQAAADDLLARTAPDPERPVVEQLRAGIEAFLDHVSGNRDAYVSLVRSSGGGDPALQAVFEATRAAITGRVLRALGVPDPPSPRLRLAVRGWVALTEEVVVDWLVTGDLARDDVISLLDHALVQLVALAAAQGG